VVGECGYYLGVLEAALHWLRRPPPATVRATAFEGGLERFGPSANRSKPF
jgi:hypothetical protein